MHRTVNARAAHLERSDIGSCSVGGWCEDEPPLLKPRRARPEITVSFLGAEAPGSQGARREHAGEWLESAILRRYGKRWRVALLHSTWIAKPSK